MGLLSSDMVISYHSSTTASVKFIWRVQLEPTYQPVPIPFRGSCIGGTRYLQQIIRNRYGIRISVPTVMDRWSSVLRYRTGIIVDRYFYLPLSNGTVVPESRDLFCLLSNGNDVPESRCSLPFDSVTVGILPEWREQVYYIATVIRWDFNPRRGYNPFGIGCSIISKVVSWGFELQNSSDC